MKKTIKGFLTICSIALMTVSANAQKIGYINANSVLEDLPEYKSAASELEAYVKQLQGMDSVKQVSFQMKYQDLAGKVQRGELAPKVQEEETKKLEEEKGNIVKFEQQMQQQVQEKRGNLIKPIIDKLNQAIKDVSKEGSYTYVLDAASGILLYFDEKNDVTNLVRTKLGLAAATPKK